MPPVPKHLCKQEPPTGKAREALGALSAVQPARNETASRGTAPAAGILKFLMVMVHALGAALCCAGGAGPRTLAGPAGRSRAAPRGARASPARPAVPGSRAPEPPGTESWAGGAGRADPVAPSRALPSGVEPSRALPSGAVPKRAEPS